MKFTYILIISLFSITNIYSQVEYDLSVRFGKSLISSETYGRSFTYNQREQISTEEYTEKNITSTNNYEILYSRLGRFEIEGSVIFPIAKGIHIKTGLGLAYQQIDIYQKFINASTTINSIDTLVGSATTVIQNPNFKPCQFENSFSEIVVPNDVSKLWSLIVPLEIEFDITQRLAVRAGGYLETPILSTHTSHSIGSVEIEEFEDYRLCRYIRNTTEDDSGSKFNDLVLGLSIGATYRITHHISANVMLRQSTNGTYSDSYNSGFSFNRNYGEFKNRSLMLGISYKFGAHKNHPESNNMEQ